MLAIKLKVVGRKNQRTFRVIVQEARSKLGGKFVEDLGWYNPHTNQYKINKDRVAYWISNGAQPTETVGRILKKAKTSDTETYETRKGRKRKKGPKAEGGQAPEGETQAQTGADQAQTGAEETPSDEAREESKSEVASDGGETVSGAEEPPEESQPEKEVSAEDESASSGNEHQAHIEKEEEKK